MSHEVTQDSHCFLHGHGLLKRSVHLAHPGVLGHSCFFCVICLGLHGGVGLFFFCVQKPRLANPTKKFEQKMQLVNWPAIALMWGLVSVCRVGAMGTLVWGDQCAKTSLHPVLMVISCEVEEEEELGVPKRRPTRQHAFRVLLTKR